MKVKLKVIYSPRCLGYSAPGHPEGPQRVRAAYEHLSTRDAFEFEFEFEFIEPQPAGEEQLLLVHTPRHLERLRRREFSDPDCPPYPEIYEHARLAAGGAILAQQVQGFSLMRPPGHHAAAERAAGFCYLNNIAIAVRASGLRTLIVDIDGHHGDGTQEVFFQDEQVVYLSLHSSPNYPGTGLRSEANCFNEPLPFRCGDALYLEALDRALEGLPLSDVEQLAVSAGFDAYARDPLASLGLSTGCYEAIGRRLAGLGLPRFAVLEGGYCVEELGANIEAFLRGLYGLSPSAKDHS